ncbi:MAG: PIN domain-containing protein [Candidatus Eremiobacterota bacterium]
MTVNIHGRPALGPPLPVDPETADLYGAAKADLERTGRPVPDSDIRIAATALRHACTLVTADAHFEEIAGLLRTHWAPGAAGPSPVRAPISNTRKPARGR